jgi:hypothetical protein
VRAFSICIAVFISFVSNAFCSSSRDVSKISKDQTYSKAIIGKWGEGESPYSIAYFEDGGVYQAWLYQSPKQEKLLHVIKGKWWIEDGKLFNSSIEIIPPFPGINPGDTAIDRIVAITEDTMILIDEEFNQYTQVKIK